MTTVVFGLVLALQVVTAQERWEDVGTRDGTELAYRDNRLLNAREVRGTTVLPFAFDAIVPVVCDFTRYTTLVPDVREARVLEGTIPTDYEVYLWYAPRFLVVAARDVVLHVRTAPASEERAGCSWSESNGRVEPRRGTIRMPLLRGTWTIERVDAARSRVTYQVAARPGGRIPAWRWSGGAPSGPCRTSSAECTMNCAGFTVSLRGRASAFPIESRYHEERQSDHPENDLPRTDAANRRLQRERGGDDRDHESDRQARKRRTHLLQPPWNRRNEKVTAFVRRRFAFAPPPRRVAGKVIGPLHYTS